MKVRYSSSSKIILDGTTANRCYYNVYTRIKNEYTENVLKFTSNVFELFLDTSKIDISVTSDSVIDIPIFFGPTNVMPIIYYKTLNETQYFPYILKNYNKTTGGGGDTGGETGGETGGGSSDTDKIIVEIKGEVIEIKNNVAYIKDNILTREKLQEVLGVTIGDIKTDPETGEMTESSGLIGKIYEAIKSVIQWLLNILFKVDDEVVEAQIETMSTILRENQTILSIPLYIMNKAQESFIGYEQEDFVLSWQTIKFQGVELIPSGSINFTEFINNDEIFKKIHDIWITVETFGLIVLLANWLRQIFFDLLGINWTGLSVEEENINGAEDIKIDYDYENMEISEKGRKQLQEYMDRKRKNPNNKRNWRR